MENNVEIDLQGVDCAVWELIQDFACDTDINLGLHLRQSVKQNVITRSRYLHHGFMLEQRPQL
jgi:hypothetical protein